MRKATRLPLPEAVYRDKVLGCWLGKNAGGTLGEPLEEKFGKTQMFQVDWYTELPEGGIPNDDLELQLIWLQALQDNGPNIDSHILAEYWLDCIAYNFDEYGLSKTNLKKGLIPPVSGWFNNWFKDCMGSPIRSEIWACVAPGVPGIAAHYAFQDAICDHAGGESVYGEIFNAVVESCAFLESDPQTLLAAGLRAIPASSSTARAIRRVMELHGEGVGWKEAREAILHEFFHPVAQHSPINLAFQTIGWLYGTDFGDALCKAVNCGWDTDCTAATLGAILGIIHGASGLPDKWILPLGNEISTNLKSGGIRNLRAPTNINELTEAVCEQSEIVLAYWENRKLPFCENDPAWLAAYRPDTLTFDPGSLQVDVRYPDLPAIMGDAEVRIAIELRNPHPDPLTMTVELDLPEGWHSDPSIATEITIPANRKREIQYWVSASSQAIHETNTCYLKIVVRGRPALQAVPIVLLGGSKWLVSPVDCKPDTDRWFETPPAGWRTVWMPGNDLNASLLFHTPGGSVFLLHHLFSDKEQPVVVGVPNSNRMKLWQNGVWLHETRTVVPLRPNQGNGNAGGDTSNYVCSVLQQGWNQFLVQLDNATEPLEAHFVIGGLHPVSPKNHGETLLDVHRSEFKWEGR